MSKTHLVPTQIVDKNNKTTTVYTKPSQSGNTKTTLPAPTSPAGKPISEQVDEIVLHVADHISFEVEAQYADTRIFIESYPRELITELADKVNTDKLGYVLSSLIYDGESADRVREGLKFLPYMKTESYDLAHTMLRSLHKYPQLPQMESYADADENTLQRCRALIRVTELLDWEHDRHETEGLGLDFTPNDAGLTTAVISDPTLVDLILSNPDKADQIAALIIERKAINAPLIAEIMNSNTPALAEGKL